ncbi:ABC transporter ATP-binding protein [Candidatus Bathyarchaeota archaeon]|nr:ABC transporter ATP-binding protein [Candidatus Bathyarchaeota archaeon]
MPLKTSDLVVATDSLNKAYQLGDVEVEVLKGITFKVARGEFVAICGPSGSGKTTLLNIISGIDRTTSGKIIVLGEDLTVQDENFLADFRCNHVGFVFQSYNLVSTLTVAENVAFPMEWSRKPEEEVETRVAELLETVGLQHRANHFPAQLSGGEQQRVAFARALANDPELILADEPTGNLDTKNGQKITQMLRTLKANGKTVIVATHDPELMQLADRTVCLEDGRIASLNE